MRVIIMQRPCGSADADPKKSRLAVRVTFNSANDRTIYAVLKRKLGREPTHAELVADVRRILTSVSVELATQGKLPHQRGRR